MNLTHRMGFTFALVLAAVSSSMAFSAEIDIQVDRLPDGEGNIFYGLRVDPFSFYGSSVSPVSPDGTKYYSYSFEPSENNLSFSELQSLLVGEWTVNTSSPFWPFETTQQVFSILPFTPSDTFDVTPIVTSPAEGAVVPPTFDVEWEWPPGTTLGGGRGISVRGSRGTNFENLSLTSYRLTVGFDPGVSSSEIVVRAGNFKNLNGFTTDVTPVDPLANNQDVYVGLRSFSWSANRTFTALNLPEPSTLFLGSLVIVGGLLQRTRVSD